MRFVHYQLYNFYENGWFIKRSVIFVACVIITATAFKDFENELADKGTIDDEAQSSISASKAKNIFVAEARVVPTYIETQTGSKTIPVEFDSAWIEKRIKTQPYYIWLHRGTLVPGYRLVIKSHNKNNLNANLIFLIRKNEGKSFNMSGIDTMDDALNDSEYIAGNTTVYLLHTHSLIKATPDLENPIKINWMPQ